MTKQEQDIFFSVIRASIWQKDIDVDIPVGFQWKTVLQAYADHAILAVVADKILALPEDRQPSKEQKKLIMWYVASNIKTHNQLNIALVDAFKKLEAAGCHPVLLKGQGLATLYPNPQMRGCGDIDIYVGEEEFETACSVINGICGVKNEDVDIYGHNLHYEVENGDVIFEIHRRIVNPKEFPWRAHINGWAQEQLKDSNFSVQILEEDIPVPNPGFNAIYLFEHLSCHYLFEGVGLRQFMDWTLFLHSSSALLRQIDFKSEIEKYSSLSAWRGLGGIIVKQLGLPQSEFPYYNKKLASISQGSILQDILASANFGSNEDEIVHYNKMQHSLKNDIHRLLFIRKRYKLEKQIYPKEAYIKFKRQLHCELGFIRRHYFGSLFSEDWRKRHLSFVFS